MGCPIHKCDMWDRWKCPVSMFQRCLYRYTLHITISLSLPPSLPPSLSLSLSLYRHWQNVLLIWIPQYGMHIILFQIEPALCVILQDSNSFVDRQKLQSINYHHQHYNKYKYTCTSLTSIYYCICSVNVIQWN